MHFIRIKALVSLLFLSIFSSAVFSQASLLKEAQRYKSKGNYTEAYQSFKEASELYYQQNATLSYVETHLEMVECQLLNGDPFLAKSLAENTLEYINSEITGYPVLKARTLKSLGSSYLNLGRNEEALENLKSAESLYGEEESLEKADCFSELGIVYWNTENKQLALQYHEKALSIRRLLLGREAVGVGDSFNNLGLVYVRDEPLQALLYFNRAKRIYEKQLGSDDRKTTLVLINMAFANSEQGNYDKAFDQLSQVKNAFDQLPGNHPNKAVVLSSIGQVHEAKAEYDLALVKQKEALQMYINLFGEKHPEVANTYGLIGRVHQKKSEFDLAAEFYQRSIYANFPDATYESLYDLPELSNYFNADFLLPSLQAKAKALEALHFEKTLNTRDLTGAIETYKLCDELITLIRRQRLSESDKLKLGEIAHEVYEDGIRLSVLLSRESFRKKEFLNTAFEFCERSKSSVLLEAITETNAKKFSGIPGELLILEDSLKDEISYIQQKLAQPDNADDENLKNLLFLYQNEYRSFVSRLETEFPNYYELKYSHKLATVEEVQKSLNSQSVLLSYYIGEEDIYVFVVSKKNVKAHILPKDPRFEKNATGIRNAIKYDVKNAFISTSQSLYTQLIPDIPNGITELVILPDGILGTIPYEALINANTEVSEFKNAPFLIKDYHISYDYSATLFTQRETDDDDTNAEILLVAPIEFAGNEVKMNTLPGSEEEIMEIRYLFMGASSRPTIKSRKEASEEYVKLDELQKYKYLHFATHGFVNESKPALSRIFLSPGNDEDGSLYAGEIYNLKINADLVTLSACETGLGKITKGEGVVGLSRALQYAGARNIIVSLWQVADASTSQMMIEFYKYNLNNEHHGYNTALRNAKLSLLNSDEYNKPYYWAPFILVGM